MSEVFGHTYHTSWLVDSSLIKFFFGLISIVHVLQVKWRLLKSPSLASVALLFEVSNRDVLRTAVSYLAVLIANLLFVWFGIQLGCSASLLPSPRGMLLSTLFALSVFALPVFALSVVQVFSPNLELGWLRQSALHWAIPGSHSLYFCSFQ